MGYYINPPAETVEDARRGKLAWLEEQGVKLDYAPNWSEVPKGCCAVVCVDNGPFQAAAIAYKPSELDYFKNTPDPRPRTWFFLDKSSAVKHSDISLEDFG